MTKFKYFVKLVCPEFEGERFGHGAFLIKGAVDQVAIITGVSKYTIYNYLQKIRANHAIEMH